MNMPYLTLKTLTLLCTSIVLAELIKKQVLPRYVLSALMGKLLEKYESRAMQPLSKHFIPVKNGSGLGINVTHL